MEIRFEYPSLDERKLYIALKLSNFGIDPRAFGIDLDKLAQEMENCTYEMIAGVISKALSQTQQGGVISQELLEHAIDTEIRKIMFHENKVLSEEERHFMSAFWGGVAVAAHHLDFAQKIACVTIRPVVVNLKEEMLGSDLLQISEEAKKEKQTGIVRGKIWTYHDRDTIGLETEKQRIAHIQMYLAGRAAERIMFGTTSSYYHSLRQWAFDQIRSLVAQGLDWSKLSRKAQDDIVDKVQELLTQYEKEVEELLQAHKTELEIVAEVLFHDQKITGAELATFLEEAKKQGPELLEALKAINSNKNVAPDSVNWLDVIDQLPGAAS